MASQDSSRLNYVDALRLLAAGLVVFQHIAERHADATTAPLVALAPGVMGVVLFFLVSGFVIPFSIRRGLDPRAFMIRRLFRIYPLYLVALAIVAIGGWTGLLAQWSDVQTASPARWIGNLLLVQDLVGVKPVLGVSWTLIIELAWYALFAAALLHFRDRAALALSIAIPASLIALALLSLAIDTRIPLARPAMIYAAVLGYQAFLHRDGSLTRRQFRLAVATFFGVTWLINWVSFGHFAHPHITLGQALGPWTVAPLLFFAVVFIPRIRNAPVLTTGLLPAIGAASYSVYLLHPVAIAAAEQHSPAGLAVPVALGLTLAMSWIGYRWVERPGIALGRILSRQRSGAALAKA